MHYFKTLIVILLFVSQAAMADTIKLKNGDQITGKVVEKTADKLLFKTSYAGEIEVVWKEVATLSLDESVAVSGSELNPKINSQPLTRKGNGLRMATALKVRSARDFKPRLGVAWKGNADLGGAVTQGNTDSSLLRFSTEAIGRSENNRLTLGGNVNRAKNNDESTEFNSKAYTQLDHFMSKKWYVYVNGAAEHDKFRDIKLRTNIGLGSGYQIYEQPDLNLSVEGGVNVVNVDYQEAQDESYPTARWALKYDQLLFANIKLFHQHEVLVSLEDSADTLVFTQTGLRVPVAKNLSASTQLNVDYDNQPAEGREKTDKTLLFSLGYGW